VHFRSIPQPAKSVSKKPTRSSEEEAEYQICRYPVDRVPPHTSFKSTQEAGRASTCYYISCSFKPHLPTWVGSSAATCPVVPDLASLPRWALALPHVLWLRTSPPCEGGLWCCHVSLHSGPHFPAEVGSSASGFTALLEG
jgi:hypothetical protein